MQCKQQHGTLRFLFDKKEKKWQLYLSYVKKYKFLHEWEKFYMGGSEGGKNRGINFQQRQNIRR
jgi:hypothetical protein